MVKYLLSSDACDKWDTFLSVFEYGYLGKNNNSNFNYIIRLTIFLCKEHTECDEHNDRKGRDYKKGREPPPIRESDINPHFHFSQAGEARYVPYAKAVPDV